MNNLTLEEAIAHAEEVADYDCYNDDQRVCANEHRQLAKWLKELKSLKENKTGHWIEQDFVSPGASFTVYQCPKCNEISWNQYNYCPECGAKMEGERYEK